MIRFLLGIIVTLCLINISSTPVFSSDKTGNNISVCTGGDSAALEGCVSNTRSDSNYKVSTAVNRRKRESHPYQEPPKVLNKQFTLKVEANAYCLRGLTSRGVQTRTGVIAVDPKVIPYGSKIHIPGYGWGTALDTGGAMRGKVIDIWMPTYSQCMSWGRRTVTITVVTP